MKPPRPNSAVDEMENHLRSITAEWLFREPNPVKVTTPIDLPWTLYFDGACEPRNPGGVGTFGWVLFAPDGRSYEGCGVVGAGFGMTNNIAEYAALERGLGYVVAHHPKIHLEIRGDSKLVVMQVCGRWGGKVEHLLAARDRCRELLKRIGSWYIDWIPRMKNGRADALSKKAYRSYHGSKSAKKQGPGLTPAWEKRYKKKRPLGSVRKDGGCFPGWDHPRAKP